MSVLDFFLAVLMLTNLPRPKAQGELYTYLPLRDSNTKRLRAVPPYSRDNGNYGFSVGRGAFHLDVAVGSWVTVAFRIKLNDVGKENGNTSTLRV